MSRARLRYAYPLVKYIIVSFICFEVNAVELPEPFWISVEKVAETRQLTTRDETSLHLKGLFNAETGAPVRVSGGLNVIDVKGRLTEDGILNFIESRPDLFPVKASNLEILHFGNVLGKTYFTARQLINSRPVLETNLLLRIAENGRVALWGADLVPEEGLKWNSMMNTGIAAEILADYAGMEVYRITSTREIWIRLNGSIAAAYHIRLAGDDPYVRPVGLVTADEGDIAGYYNGVCDVDIEGMVRGPVLPVRFDEEPEWMEFSDQRVQLGQQESFTDENGEYSFSGLTDGQRYFFRMQLRGPWVQVIYDDGPDAYFSADVTAPDEFSPSWMVPDDGRLDEFNVFYHTNFIHDFYRELDRGFTGLDYPVPATVAFRTNYENAFWNGEGMFFGAGGGRLHNLALFSDVIYHEYTHGVTGHIYINGDLPYYGQSGALNEAWSDYFPCSINNHSAVAPGIYVGLPGGWLRNLDNNRRYPDNWVNEVHSDGLIAGGAMWDVREELGADYCDSLFHYSRYGLANTFIGYLQEVLVADDDDGNIRNGTPNYVAIYRGFGRHGIGPGETPKLVLRNIRVTDENGDGELWQGERVEINLTVQNDVSLYPPPAENVMITGEYLSFINWQINGAMLGEIGAGDNIGLPEPLRFTVEDDAPTIHADLALTLTANDGDYREEYSIRMTFGDPRILLVDDCGTVSYFNRFDAAVIDLHTAANLWNTNNGAPSSERLAEHDIVIWYTGDRRAPLSDGEMQLMQEFAQNGGGLILTGQHIGPQLEANPGFAELVGVEESIDSLFALAVLGVEGQPVSEGIEAALIGYPGAGNQTAPSGIVAADNAQPIYTYYRSDEVAAVWNNLEDGGAVFYFGFGLEAVSGASISDPAGEMLLPIFRELGYELDVPSDKAQRSRLPSEYTLSAPFPNPFNPVATVAYALPEAAEIKLTVFNLLGREVLNVFEGSRNPGFHEATINLKDQAAGIYFISLEIPDRTIVRKGLLIK